MAAPHVAGVASLLYSRKPSLTPAEVLTILQNTVTNFPGGSSCTTASCGSGIVNAGAAVAAVANPVPTITGLNPSSATPGGPAFTLTVNGTGFVNSSVVHWNGSNRTTTYVSSTQLTAAITAADIATPGTASVTVLNPAPGGGASNTMSFARGQPCADHHWSQSVLGHTGRSRLHAHRQWHGFRQWLGGALERCEPHDDVCEQHTTDSGNHVADIATPGTASVTVFNPAPGGGASNAVSFLVGTRKKVYLPLVVRKSLSAPVLNAIDNADGDGNYTVSWNAVVGATSYTLEEDDNATFTSPTTQYNAAGTSWNAAGKAAGTYYYRVRASNSYGSSGWSNVQTATVSPVSASHRTPRTGF